MAEAQRPTLADKASVLEGLPDHPAVKAIHAWDSAALEDARYDRNELTLAIAADKIRQACFTLQAAGYTFFEDLTAVDWYPQVPRFQLSYHILSFQFRDRVRLRVMVDEANLAVDSITPVWPGANYYEREVFDLFGVRFNGHSDMRRIMLPDDWKGHPLRKDYPVEGYR